MTQATLDFTVTDKRRECTCPHCGHKSIEYRRSLNSNMALSLLVLLKSGNTGWVHMEELLRSNGYKRCGDFSYLVHYRFIEKLKEKREDGSSRNGLYKITSYGIMFAEGKTTAKEKFIMYNGKHIGFEGELITIKEALGTKFNYEQIFG